MRVAILGPSHLVDVTRALSSTVRTLGEVLCGAQRLPRLEQSLERGAGWTAETPRTEPERHD